MTHAFPHTLMRTLLCLLLLTFAPLAHAQRGTTERAPAENDRGWDPELGDIELVITYEQDVSGRQATPAQLTLRSSSRLVEALSTADVEINGSRGTRVPLRTEGRGTLSARANVPSWDALESIALLLADRRVYFPIPPLDKDEDGNQNGTYGDDESGFWMVIVIGTNDPPPSVVIIIGTPPKDKIPEYPDEPGETEETEETEESEEGEM